MRMILKYIWKITHDYNIRMTEMMQDRYWTNNWTYKELKTFASFSNCKIMTNNYIILDFCGNNLYVMFCSHKMNHKHNYSIKTNYVHKTGTTSLPFLCLRWLTDWNFIQNKKDISWQQFHSFLMLCGD
jgi:hypothetical protein